MIYSVSIGAVISIVSAVLCIITSQIRRNFLTITGFVDMGPDIGFKVVSI